MKKSNNFTKVLTIVGVILVWFPILAPVLLSLIALGAMRVFRLDYLMPAELFPFALVGGLLLVWAALRAHSRLGIIAWSLVKLFDFFILHTSWYHFPF